MNSRREAIFILTHWIDTRDFPDRMIPAGDNHAFISDLVYTTIRRLRTLAWVLEQLVAKTPKGETEAALLVGAAQILFMPSVAEYAAVNETVAAAKLASKQTGGLVNAVLRNLIHQRGALLEQLAKQPPGIRMSHPDSLITRWLNRFDEAEVAALCEWNNQPAKTFLAWDPNAEKPFTLLPRGTRVETLPEYQEGRFVVQDPSTAAAISLMELKPGQNVLDACAAPGGKTVQLAWRMGKCSGEPVARQAAHSAAATREGKNVARDFYVVRLTMLRDNLERTRQRNVVVAQNNLIDDADAIRSEYGLFDRILLDVPCSNTGVLRRRPDARWRWTTKRMKKLCETQAKLLESALTLLAPNGRIVYSTCSLEPEENRKQIAAFRKAHPEVACVGVEERIPTRSQTDGVFACALER
jgi:16S rRNA (cytosine967-C5)-methyltransferase